MHLGNFGYLGAFISGILFVSSFTVATSVLIIITLAETISPLKLSLIAALGSVFGDLIIFRFVKDNLSQEIKEIYKHIGINKSIERIFNSKLFNWTLPVMGALLIALPFPDELGISLLGLSDVSRVKFICISFLLNLVGIFIIVFTSVLI